jgi:hypothetical protein
MARLECVLVLLISLHSLAVGVGLLAIGVTGPLFGFGAVTPAFFAHQGGAFHLIVGAGYWLEYRAQGTVRLLLLAKASATVFLLGASLLTPVPWLVPLSALGDLAMGLVVALVHRRVRAEAAGAMPARATAA